MNRRKYLAMLGTFSTATIAGCAEETDNPQVESTDNESESVDSPDSSNNSTEQESSENEGQESSEGEDDSGQDNVTFELGETALFSQEDQEIEFQAYNARLKNVLVSSRDNRLASESPDSDLFLLIDAKVKNIGNETVPVPRTVDLVLGGTQYSRSSAAALALDNAYSELTELRPGASQTGSLIFSIPDTTDSGQLFVEWGLVETVTGEWEFNLENIERDILDYSGNSVGEGIEFGTQELRYDLFIRDIELHRSYVYEGFRGNEKEEASDGRQWAIVDIFVQNTGDQTVTVPGSFSMRVIADGQQYTSGVYLGDDGYSGGRLSPDSGTDGVLVFEVPETASKIRFEVALTQDITAEWVQN